MTGNQNVYAQGNQIAVLPDGTLVNVFAILFKGSGIQPPQANQVFMAVTRSTDGGRSWQAPNARGFFLGDYMGLEAIGDDLLAFLRDHAGRLGERLLGPSQPLSFRTRRGAHAPRRRRQCEHALVRWIVTRSALVRVPLSLKDDFVAIHNRFACGLRALDRGLPGAGGQPLARVQIGLAFPEGQRGRLPSAAIEHHQHSLVARLLLDSWKLLLTELLDGGVDSLGRQAGEPAQSHVHGHPPDRATPTSTAYVASAGGRRRRDRR